MITIITESGNLKKIIYIYYIGTMSDKFHTEYQYDRCSSRGICSINPATSALLEVILLYLRSAAYCGMELESNGIKDKNIKKIILNTLSVLSSNYEISEINFWMINSVFKKELPEIINYCADNCVDFKKPDIKALLDLGENLNDYIRYGEKKFNKRIQNISSDSRDLYRALFILVKSLGINISMYEDYGKELKEEILILYEVFNLLDANKNKNDLKNMVYKVAKADCDLMKKIRIAQEEIYGEQGEYDVSFSTEKGKAMLIVGSNLKELENILEDFKDKEVDIYTHDNMILAHTFPKFKEYKNLKGQFGQGMESCLLDFSTFPGPIILTKNSLFNVESLYRGRLFTTDFAYSKGVIPIKNNDFSAVYKSIEESRGFKTGKNCNSEKIGFSLKKTEDTINEKISSGKYKKAVVIGFCGYSNEEIEYFDSFFNHIPNNLLTISFSYCNKKENNICLNGQTDISSLLKVSEMTLNNIDSASIIIPFTDRHTLSVMIYLSSFSNSNIFAGNWNHIVLNSNLLSCLKRDFNIYELKFPKKDLRKILNI